MHKLIWLLCLLPLALHAQPIQLGVALPDESSALLASLDRATALGMRRVRIRADWARLEPARHVWHFDTLDAAIDAAHARGLEVVLTFGPSAPWSVSYLSQPRPEELRRARPDLAPFRAYVTTVARRYQHRVAYYQVWERPSGTTLLAVPHDVYALFRTAASAVHAVNPALRVIVPEPADIDLGWLAGYLRETAGTDGMADILSLSPRRHATDPETFWWRVQVLRQRVLPARGAPALWAEVPFSSDIDCGCRLLAAALLQGITGITLVPEGTLDAVTADTDLATGIRMMAALQGTQLTGWCTLAPGTPAGAFPRDGATVLLALPLRPGETQLVPTATPGPREVAVPDGELAVQIFGAPPQRLFISKPTPLSLATRPLTLIGAAVTVAAGMPNSAPPRVTDAEVSLDPTGQDPLAVRALPQLSGGAYRTESREGRTLLCTVRDIAPWVHLDVPDGFLFYNIARAPVTVTVRLYGARTQEKVGFNLYYDALGGMNTSPWQWVAVGPDRVFSYTIRLDDALFANNEGYDLRINMGGSVEGLRIVDVTVRKAQ